MQTLVEVDSYFVFVAPLLHKIENLSRCFVFVALCNVQEAGNDCFTLSFASHRENGSGKGQSRHVINWSIMHGRFLKLQLLLFIKKYGRC